MGAPSVYYTPFNISKLIAAAIQLIQTASSRAAAVLRVLRERDRPLDAIFLHLTRRLRRERPSIAKGRIRLVRGRFRVQLVEQLCHTLALELGVT